MAWMYSRAMDRTQDNNVGNLYGGNISVTDTMTMLNILSWETAVGSSVEATSFAAFSHGSLQISYLILSSQRFFRWEKFKIAYYILLHNIC